MTEESDFRKFLPKITEVTVVEVAQSWGIADDIVSLDGKRTGLNHFILMLATDAKKIGPYLLNPTCARALCARLLAEGFGPPPKS
jgi:hypothetical protein